MGTGCFRLGTNRLTLEEQRQANDTNLEAAFRKAKLRIAQELERTGFFTGTLSISVQNGVLRTSKIAVEECDNYHAAKV